MTKLVAVTALLVLSFSLRPPVRSDWPQAGGPTRDSCSPETGLSKSWSLGGPPLLWTFRKTGVGYSGPAIVGNRLFISGGRGDSEFVLALDLDTPVGQPPREIWAAKIGPLFTWKGNSWNTGPNATPTVDGDLIYALGGFGDLLCLEIGTGKELWRVNLPRDLGGEVNPIGGGLDDPTPLGWGYASAPLVDGDKLICIPGGKQGLIAALDKRTGKLLWRSKEIPDQASYSSPMVVQACGVRQYIQVVNSGIVGVAAVDGKLLWRYQRQSAYDDVVIATPVVKDNYIFATVGFGQGCDLIKLHGEASSLSVEKIFSNKSVQNRDGGMVRLGDYLYGHSEGKGWLCMEFTTGKQAWMERSKLERGSVTAADGSLYCCSEEGEVVLLKATSKAWTELGRYHLPEESKQRRPSGRLWTHPVIAHGRLFLRDQELLFCYDIAAK